jgi:hypothetical protein
MRDTNTTQPSAPDVHEADGHGKHRGAVSSQDGVTAPNGRHRKPAEMRAEAAA